MSSDTMTISSPISIKDNSKERVALELLQIVTRYESKEDNSKNRAYWLTLYSQCLQATSGLDIESIQPKV